MVVDIEAIKQELEKVNGQMADLSRSGGQIVCQGRKSGLFGASLAVLEYNRLFNDYQEAESRQAGLEAQERELENLDRRSSEGKRVNPKVADLRLQRVNIEGQMRQLEGQEADYERAARKSLLAGIVQAPQAIRRYGEYEKLSRQRAGLRRKEIGLRIGDAIQSFLGLEDEGEELRPRIDERSWSSSLEEDASIHMVQEPTSFLGRVFSAGTGLKNTVTTSSKFQKAYEQMGYKVIK